MGDRTSTQERTGADMGQAGANMGVSRQLSSLLPGCGLDKLTDDEALQLIAFMNFLDSEAAEEGFKEGWNAGRDYEQRDYNGDVTRLLCEGPPQNH